MFTLKLYFTFKLDVYAVWVIFYVFSNWFIYHYCFVSILFNFFYFSVHNYVNEQWHERDRFLKQIIRPKWQLNVRTEHITLQYKTFMYILLKLGKYNTWIIFFSASLLFHQIQGYVFFQNDLITWYTYFKWTIGNIFFLQLTLYELSTFWNPRPKHKYLFPWNTVQHLFYYP